MTRQAILPHTIPTKTEAQSGNVLTSVVDICKCMKSQISAAGHGECKVDMRIQILEKRQNIKGFVCSLRGCSGSFQPPQHV